jgi:acyl-CoA reductase-like NAD-dependent aldehyde dehydrogenase
MDSATKQKLQLDNIEEFYAACAKLKKAIKENESALIALLSHYETHETVQDEISRSMETLDGIRKEFSTIKRPLSGLALATFFPLNLPLYSLVLFAVVPSAFAAHVFIRPPEVMEEVLSKLWKLLDLNHLFPNIALKVTPRHIFVQLYASEADAIIFTGKHENAIDIHNKCPNALLLYNGSGVNPFLLFDNANIPHAAKKAVEMRCFNSGQDCAGPDAFFVSTRQCDKFIAALRTEFAHIKVGDTTDPETNVGPTMKEAYIAELMDWLEGESQFIEYGGDIDVEKRLVSPTIMKKPISEHKVTDEYHEFFAPFFYVLCYNSDEELLKALSAKPFRDRGMYISVFGDNSKIEDELDFVKVLKNKIVNDVERGNTEYGGYGERANFLMYRGHRTVQPVLISRDLHVILGQ